MALMWPMGHGDSRERPALDPDRGRESITPEETWTPAYAGVTALFSWLLMWLGNRPCGITIASFRRMPESSGL